MTVSVYRSSILLDVLRKSSSFLFAESVFERIELIVSLKLTALSSTYIMRVFDYNSETLEQLLPKCFHFRVKHLRVEFLQYRIVSCWRTAVFIRTFLVLVTQEFIDVGRL